MHHALIDAAAAMSLKCITALNGNKMAMRRLHSVHLEVCIRAQEHKQPPSAHPEKAKWCEVNTRQRPGGDRGGRRQIKAPVSHSFHLVLNKLNVCATLVDMCTHNLFVFCLVC